MNIYEGMFLFEAKEKADFEPLRKHALEILERNGAKVLREKKWREGKLAYEIRRVRRGTWYLTYFEAPSSAVAPIRHDCKISEKVLRVMIIRRDALPSEDQFEEAGSAKESGRREAAGAGAAKPRAASGDKDAGPEKPAKKESEKESDEKKPEPTPEKAEKSEKGEETPQPAAVAESSKGSDEDESGEKREEG